MKKLLIPAMILILVGCASLKRGPTSERTEISDELWDEIGRELARVSVQVDSINGQLESKKKELAVQVKEPWTKTTGVFRVGKASKIEEYPMKRKSVIALSKKLATGEPAKEEELVVFEALGGAMGGPFIGVASKHPEGMYMSAKQKFMAAGKPVIDYTHALNTVEKVRPVKQFVS